MIVHSGAKRASIPGEGHETAVWTDWGGGENPAPGEKVYIRFGDGWESRRPVKTKNLIWRWVSKGLGGDIHAYRIEPSGRTQRSKT